MMPLTVPETVTELCNRAQTWAESYYRFDGKPTKTHINVRAALVPLRMVAGPLNPNDLRAEHIYQCQRWMLGKGMCRSSINSYIFKIKQILRWAARPPQRWISATTIADIELSDSIKQHRSTAREGLGRHPVSWDLVASTLAVADMELAALIRVHWFTGARPSEIVRLNRREMVERDGVLIYSPRAHKTAWHGKTRNIVIGPQGQAALESWAMRVPFRPNIFRWRTACGYHKAIMMLCLRWDLPHWSPGQIRHSYLSRVGTIDLEGARAAAGHGTVSMTEHYVHRDISLAIELQKRFG